MSIEILQVWQVKKNVIKGGSFKISIHKKKKMLSLHSNIRYFQRNKNFIVRVYE